MSKPFVSVKVWYPVGMVDTSTLAGVLRASNQRRTPAGEPPNQTRTQREEESPNFLQQIAPFLGVQEYEPGDSYWDKVSKNWASNPMNPVPQTWGAISEGRAPTGGELGTDAAFLAGASLLGPAAKPVAQGVQRAASRTKPLLTGFSEDASREAYRRSLLDRVLASPETSLGTVRSSQSLPGIVNSGRFRTNADLGTSGAQMGGSSRGNYDRVRAAAEEMLGSSGQRVYGALTNRISHTTPEPFRFGLRGQRRHQDWLEANQIFSPSAAENYGTRPLDMFPDNFPVRYETNPSILENAELYFGDSMLPQFDQSLHRQRTGLNVQPEKVTSTISDILESGNFPGAEGWIKGGSAPAYVEGSVPNLLLDDVARIQPLATRPSVGRGYEQTVRDALGAAGRDIPVESAPNMTAMDRLLQRPPRLSEQVSTQFNALLRQIRNNFNPRTDRYGRLNSSLIDLDGDDVL